MLTPWKESYDQPRHHIKKQRHYFANKGPSSQGYGFSSSHVWMWELNYKERWARKNWCFFFKIFIYTLFYFTILYWFCHTLTWIHHGCIQAPNPESPSHLSSHIISLDHPHAPAPSILYPVLNTDWHFVSYMIAYMFQCHSPVCETAKETPMYRTDFWTLRERERVGWFAGWFWCISQCKMIPQWHAKEYV